MWVLRRNIWVYDPTLASSPLNPIIRSRHYIIPLLYDDENQVINMGILTTDRSNRLGSISTKIEGDSVNNQNIIFLRSKYNTVLSNIGSHPNNLRANNYNSSILYCIDNPKGNIRLI